MKKILKFNLNIIIIITVLFILSGCKKSENEKESLEEKVNTEISYIDSELVAIVNALNNIDYAKYKVVEQETEGTNKSSNNSESGSSKQESEGEKTQESGGGSEESKQQGGSSDGSSKTEKENATSSSSNKVFSMQANNVLGKQESDINWSQLKNKIENLYTTWTTVSADLKKIGVSDEELNKFSNKIDFVAYAIKSENKEETMNNVIELYEYLPKFVEVHAKDGKEKNVLYSKYNLLVCYKYADLEKWDELQSSLSDLKMSFSNISNQKDKYKGKDINISNAFVIINEMNNTINIKEKDIFFVKYKNLMQELNIIFLS